jgi:methyl-accepting chemotaxis protein
MRDRAWKFHQQVLSHGHANRMHKDDDFMSLSIRGKLISAFSTMLIVLFATSGLIWIEVSSIQKASEWTDHTTKVLDALASVVSGMVDQETGVRGYLVSGDDRFLDPFNGGQKEFSNAWNEAKSLTADNPVQPG